MKTYEYETCCVDIRSTQDIEALNKMVEEAKPVSYQTMLRHCSGLLEWAEGQGYTVRGSDLHLKNDWHVGYFRSSFAGEPCYFVRWSAIEFIWVRSGQCRTRGAATAARKSGEIPERTLQSRGASWKP